VEVRAQLLGRTNAKSSTPESRQGKAGRAGQGRAGHKESKRTRDWIDRVDAKGLDKRVWIEGPRREGLEQQR
jgi:hypothetical protein